MSKSIKPTKLFYAAVISVAVAIVVLSQQCNKSYIHEKDEVIELLKADIKKTKDKHGNEIAMKEVANVKLKTAMSVLEDEIASLRKTDEDKSNELKKLKRELQDEKKRVKDLNQKLIAYSKTDAGGQLTLRDTVYQERVVYRDKEVDSYRIDYEDQWFGVTGRLFPTLNQVELNPTYDCGFTSSIAKGKDGKQSLSIKFNSPYVETKEIIAFDFEKGEKKNNKKWGIGFHIGVGVGTDGKVRPNASAGINYNLIRF